MQEADNESTHAESAGPACDQDNPRAALERFIRALACAVARIDYESAQMGKASPFDNPASPRAE